MAYTKLHTLSVSSVAVTSIMEKVSAPLRRFSDGTFVGLFQDGTDIVVVHGNATATVWTTQSTKLTTQTVNDWFIDENDKVHVICSAGTYDYLYCTMSGSDLVVTQSLSTTTLNNSSFVTPVAFWSGGYAYVLAVYSLDSQKCVSIKVNDSTAPTLSSESSNLVPTWPWTAIQETLLGASVIHDGDGVTRLSGAAADFALTMTAKESGGTSGAAAWLHVDIDTSTGVPALVNSGIYWRQDDGTDPWPEHMILDAVSDDDILAISNHSSNLDSYGKLGADSDWVRSWTESLVTDHQWRLFVQSDGYGNLRQGLVRDPDDPTEIAWIVAADAVYGVIRGDAYQVVRVPDGDIADQPLWSASMWIYGACPDVAAGGKIIAVAVSSATDDYEIWTPYSLPTTGELWGKIIV